MDDKTANVKKVCVFCGASVGKDQNYLENAKKLGETIAKNNLTLVYGGSDKGTMGALADSALNNFGSVIGIIPKNILEKENKHENLTTLYIVESMQERKEKMIEISDAFIVLPGGGGTLEEFSDVFSRKRLGLHDKPIGILNTKNYYDGLLTNLKAMVEEGFLQEKDFLKLKVSENPNELLEACLKEMAAYSYFNGMGVFDKKAQKLSQHNLNGVSYDGFGYQ